MALDINRFGLSVLYEPPETINCKVDIFFVHGLFGHPKETWTSHVRREISEPPAKKKIRLPGNTADEVVWPRDLLPSVVPNARIFTWGYDVQIYNLFSSTSRATVFQHAETLLLDITSVRRTPMEKNRPIIFVAHSLGGIVVKEALCVSKMESTFLKDILKATTGVCFLGTPHKGSKIASIGKTVFSMSKAIAFQDPNMKILRALEVQSDVLERIGRNFSQILGQGGLKVHSFREELKTKGIMVVDAVSATLDHFAETRGSIHANHRDMVRFSSAEDVGFLRICAIFTNWIQEDAAIGHLENQGSLSYSVYRKRLASLSDEELMTGCLASLDRIESRQRIRTIEERFEGTYTWLFNQQVNFEEWLLGKLGSPVFWISGKPGSGKSTMMKFALHHPMTLKHLKDYHDSPWIVAGFFFHDRGSVTQKSLDGLLREILYQMLQQRPQLIRPLLEEYSSSLVFTEGEKGLSFSVNWNPNELEAALLSLASNYRLNICLFIDALDEHHGNHQSLITFIQKLSRLPEENDVRLRICLASRPENIFQQRFKDAPGFAIHDYTAEDIKKFTRVGMADIAAEAMNGFEELFQEVLEKARGVFLWVKLVISELVDNWLSGDTVNELRRTLSEIPDELQDLYRRTLQRGRLHNTRAVQKGRIEAYVMFQMVQYSPPSLSVGKFTKLVQYNILGDQFKDDQFTESQMRRRINDRSAGLLEVVDDIKERTTVQFIHQTTREYFLSDKGYRDLYEDRDDRPIETGLIYFIRASLWLRALDASFYAPEIMVIESKHQLSAVSQFDTTYIRRFLKSKCITWPVPLALLQAVLDIDDVTLSKAFIAVVFSFDMSLSQLVAISSASLGEHGGILLRTTVAILIAKSRSQSPSEVSSAARCLSILVQSGIAPTKSFDGATCVEDLKKSGIPEVDLVQAMFAMRIRDEST